MITSMVSLIAFVFFGNFSLALSLTYISKREIMIRSVISILILVIGLIFVFFNQFIVFQIFEIDFPYFWRGIETYFYFYINGFPITFFHKFWCCCWWFKSAQINKHYFWQKYSIKVFSFKVIVRSNFLRTACKYFKYVALFRIYSSWY